MKGCGAAVEKNAFPKIESSVAQIFTNLRYVVDLRPTPIREFACANPLQVCNSRALQALRLLLLGALRPPN